ncbi:MAG: Carbonic anhydrase precursor [Candidatus Accumulibacter phosphatis]|uniref:carbonic anhydrase n=1 Tax=Candidatus Accumulibacter phosphatis TaxID=327160 RepID=A0A080LZ57_9PROT|nr:surface-adhesin E family protein [Accumulibacter sp.]KFB74051.1 MAG: Carbonic anhydrase precursor [Candidatus Accumulibacter phosphatis]HRF12814.1 carbonic anhydrase family protein [Candidatus Accumulibacter phosphatis]
MHPDLRILATCCVAIMPAIASAAWQVISAEPGKRVEVDRSSIRKEENGKTVALGRIILEKPIIDPKTSSSYRIVQALSRYDCTLRSYSTLKRSYFKEEGELLREEDVKVQVEMPIRSGMLDDKLLREVCRPKPGPDTALAASRTADKVNEASGELRKANEALVQKEVRRANLQTLAAEKAVPEAKPATLTRLPMRAVSAAPVVLATAAPEHQRIVRARPAASDEPPHTPSHAHVHWAYEGEGGPENWGKLKPEYVTCDTGKRQSPIDIRDGFRVDLEAIEFSYRQSAFRVVDNGHTIQVEVDGSSIRLLGKTYDLIQFHFHRPSEERVNGRSFDMVAHLVHKSVDGRIAVLAVLLEKGMENPMVQTVWNNLPLEKNEYVTPPGLAIDVAQLLPEDRSYYTYMGSLTTPPCSEGVLWLVLKQPQQISPEQFALFTRLYRHNARPVQAGFGRMIKESR